MGNTLNGEKSIEIKHICIYNKTTWEIFRSSLSVLDRFDKKKTISQNSPFKAQVKPMKKCTICLVQ
jgi:hypothetical protein